MVEEMTKPIIIGVDVDLVLAASDVKWVEWMCRLTGYRPALLDKEVHSYDLSLYFKDRLDKLGIDPLDFYRNEGVYDWIDPEEGSQEGLKRLKESIDCKIIAVSHCKGNHFKSKWQFLKRNFGDCIDGFIATKEKWAVRCDFFIDDRNEYLNGMPSDVFCIRYSTPYTQFEGEQRGITEAKSWQHVVDIILFNEEI